MHLKERTAGLLTISPISTLKFHISLGQSHSLKLQGKITKIITQILLLALFAVFCMAR